MSRVTKKNGVTVIELGLSYDSLDQEKLDEIGGILLGEARHAEPPLLVVDFSQTKYVGPGFLRLLLHAQQWVKEREGRLCVCAPSDFSREVIDSANLSDVFEIFASREDAVAELSGGVSSPS